MSPISSWRFAALLLVAHGMGSLFVRFRQPRAIGEVVGGLLLGATLFGDLAPHAQAWLFPTTGATPTVLAAVNQLGLLLLLFITGVEIRRVFHREERRTVGAVFVTGMLIPFLAGVAHPPVHEPAPDVGPERQHQVVPARLRHLDGGHQHPGDLADHARPRHPRHRTSPASSSGVAVLEDLVLYVVLAIAIGYAGAQAGALFGLPDALGITGGSNTDLGYHVLATVAFLAVSLLAGPAAYRWIGGLRVNLIQRASPIGHQLTFMFLLTIAALGLGIEAFFGALVAGIVVGSTEPEPSEATMAVTSFALAFFIPIYFAMIGLGLDLVHGFSVVFFAGFLLAACAIKAASVFVGARAAGENSRSSLNLAVAMNARGGPGIVVASTAFAAGIISQPFYAVLVLLAIVTSLAAGAWLDRVPRDRAARAARRRACGRGPPRWLAAVV